MSEDIVQVEGKEQKERSTQERSEDQTLLEQASQQDLETKRPTDETPFSRDIVREPQEEVVEEAKENVKNGYNNDRWRASLPKARAALADKRARAKAEGRNGKQGTPAPDLITDIAKMMDEKMAHVLTHLEDLKKVYAKEGPLQAQHAVLPAQTAVKEVPEHPSDLLALPKHDKPEYPVLPDRTELEIEVAPKRMKIEPPQIDPVQEQQKFTRKFQKALEHMEFQNQEMHDRVKVDPSLGRRRDMPGMQPGRAILF
jgi:hypothetical protein